MTTIRAAVEALHASRTALTEGERVQRWWATDEGGLNWWAKAGGLSVANAGQGDTARNAVRHIALVASPHVVEALEQLLEAIDQYANQYDGAVWIERAAVAYAEAITRRTA